MRQRRDGADFDETEAETQQRVGDLGILVEPGRNADRIGEIEPEGGRRKPPVVAGRLGERRVFQHPDGKPVRVFRIDRLQKRPREPFEKTDHGSSSANTWRPSAPRASGRVQRTAASGSAA